MSSLNQVTLCGNVGRDPEIKSLQNGGKVANLSIATSEHWKDKNTGEKKERTEWHRIVVWSEGLIDVIDRYVVKGDKLLIVGKLQTRKWQDQSGNDRYATEVVLQGWDAKLVMLGGGKGGGGGSRTSQAAQRRDEGPDDGPEDFDDDIPF